MWIRPLSLGAGALVLTACGATDLSTSETVAEPPTATSTQAPVITTSPETATTSAHTTTTTTKPSPTTTSTTRPDTAPPVLEVHYPIDGSTVAKKLITFRGVTEPGTRVYAGRYEADVDQDGNWSIVLVLAPGKTDAVLVAQDDAGNTTSVGLVVTYQPPTTTTSAPACAGLAPAVIPEAATKLSKVRGDLDGNGVDDTVTVYFDTADETSWVHMELDYGYAASVPIEDAQWNSPEAISTVRFGTSDALALVKVSEGATTEFFGVFAFIGCDSVYTTSDPSGYFGFAVGAGGTHVDGVACTPNGIVRASAWSEGAAYEDGPWEVTRDTFEYVPRRGHFVFVSSSTTQLFFPDDEEEIFAVQHFDCPGGRLQ